MLGALVLVVGGKHKGAVGKCVVVKNGWHHVLRGGQTLKVHGKKKLQLADGASASPRRSSSGNNSKPTNKHHESDLLQRASGKSHHQGQPESPNSYSPAGEVQVHHLPLGFIAN